MENENTNNPIQQQTFEQGPTIPISDELSICVDDDSKGGNQQTNQIADLEKQVKNTNRRMEILTAIMAISAFMSAFVAYFQWNTDDVQFYQNQRPYVMSRIEPLVFSANKEIIIKVLNGNYGKTPALRAGGAAKLFIGPNATMQADNWFKKQAPSVFAKRYETIIPQNTIASGVEANVSTVRTGRAIGIEEFNSIINNDFFLVIGMRQAYMDSIGNLYWTDTCMGYLVTGMFANCTTHNEVH